MLKLLVLVLAGSFLLSSPANGDAAGALPAWASQPVTRIMSPNNRDILPDPAYDDIFQLFGSSRPAFPLARLLWESLRVGNASAGTLGVLDRLWNRLPEWNSKISVGVKADLNGRFVRWELYFCFTVFKEMLATAGRVIEGARSGGREEGSLSSFEENEPGQASGDSNHDFEVFSSFDNGLDLDLLEDDLLPSHPGVMGVEAVEGAEAVGGADEAGGSAPRLPISWVTPLHLPPPMRPPETEVFCMLHHLVTPSPPHDVWMEGILVDAGVMSHNNTSTPSNVSSSVFSDACGRLLLPPRVRGISIDLYPRGGADGTHYGGNVGGNVAPNGNDEGGGALSDVIQVYTCATGSSDDDDDNDDPGGSGGSNHLKRIMSPCEVGRVNLTLALNRDKEKEGMDPPTPAFAPAPAAAPTHHPRTLLDTTTSTPVPLEWEGRDICGPVRMFTTNPGPEVALKALGFPPLPPLQLRDIDLLFRRFGEGVSLCIARKWRSTTPTPGVDHDNNDDNNGNNIVSTLYISWQGLSPSQFISFAEEAGWDPAFISHYAASVHLYKGQPLEVVQVYRIPDDGSSLVPDRSGMHFTM